MSCKKLVTIAENQLKVYDTGHKDGHKVGYATGQEIGYNKGKTEGYNEGYTKGYGEGQTAGYSDGYTNGYDKRSEEVASLNEELKATLNGGDTSSEATLDENISQAKSDFQAIKTSIVEKGIEVAEGTKTEDYAEKIDKVYLKGAALGIDVFWEEYLDGGNRTDFNYAFAGKGWTDKSFKPTKNLVVKGANYMFNACKIKNLKAITEELGITIDFSQCTTFTYTFGGGATITDIGVVDIRSMTSTLQYFTYNNGWLRNFEKLIVDEDNTFSNTAFQSTSNLEEIRIEGVIGKNGLNMQWCKKLSHESLISIINCLQDKSGDTSGTTWLVTIGDENIEKLTENELLIAYNKGWNVK